MSSILAVVVQLYISGTNYIIFFIMVRLLQDYEFTGFSNAVGLNMLAFTLAEAGISYVAPNAIKTGNGILGSQISGAFISISFVLYFTVTIFGYYIWNLFSSIPLQSDWVISYSIFFIPILLTPAWLLNISIDKLFAVSIFVSRTLMILLIWNFPSEFTLKILGCVAFLLSLWGLKRKNSNEIVIMRPNGKSIKVAISAIRHVFVARTATYVAYSSMPILVGILLGNNSASFYIMAERMKSLYSTFFQPILQSVYLWGFRTEAGKNFGKQIVPLLQLFNILACIVAIIVAKSGWLNFLGERIAGIIDSPIIWISAAFSVSSSCILYLNLLPNSKFSIFRNASYFQLLGFAFAWGWLVLDPSQTISLLLFFGELTLLLAILFFIKFCNVRR